MFDIKLCNKYLNMEDNYWQEITYAFSLIKKDTTLFNYLKDIEVNFFEEQSTTKATENFSKVKNYVLENNILYPEIIFATIFSYNLPKLIHYFASFNTDEQFIENCIADYKIWQKEYEVESGKFGIANFEWLSILFCGKIFRLGRLQFEKVIFTAPYYIFKKNNNIIITKKEQDNYFLVDSASGLATNEIFNIKDEQPILKTGDHTLSIHIAKGEKLDISNVNQSLKQAKQFFEKINYPNTHAICISWLLDPNLEIYGKNSLNIKNFNNLFSKFLYPHPSQAINRVFGKEYINSDFKNLPENTSLQLGLKQFLLSGGIPKDMGGFILL